ncbi:hypothetical protein J437_LFUL018083 [Ladona fulva]|uniref:SH3 domain-containing protein n=1 Tax=Ladona fulva TaxID=123851 RepID=A0A8K0KR05_LADFU|nr:hypothetical protein J437_LFUL018083 [Ladona fulva]
MEEGTIGKAVRDFLTTSEGELFLNEGDIVQITKIKDMHWCYGYSAGKEGLIPTNYIMEIEIPIIGENQELFASLADFLPQQAGDLSFARGGYETSPVFLCNSIWQNASIALHIV